MAEHRRNDVPTRLRTFAKRQRSEQTRADAPFWQGVRAGRLGGHKFKRQVPVAPYIVDFLCIAARVIVELDGPPHLDEEQRPHDQRRDAFLRAQGFRVLRFTNDEFLGNPDPILSLVRRAIEHHFALPPPFSGGGWPRAAGSGEGSANVPEECATAPLPVSLTLDHPLQLKGRGDGDNA